MSKTDLDSLTNSDTISEGMEDIVGWLDDDNRSPRYNSQKHIQAVVDTFIDEVNERTKHLPADTVNFCFRSLLSDIALQLSFALDNHQGRSNRKEYPNELRRVAVKLNSALAAAYKFAGLLPVVPSKTLRALVKMNRELALQI